MTEPNRVLDYDAARPAPRRPVINWKRLLVIAIVLVIACAIYYPFSPAAQQSANLDLANSLLPSVRHALQADPRFTNVRIGVTTVSNGSFVVRGSVASGQDLSALRLLVGSHHLPVAVQWVVVVDDHATTQGAPAIMEAKK